MSAPRNLRQRTLEELLQWSCVPVSKREQVMMARRKPRPALTVDEVAERLAVDPTTVLRAIHRGELRAARVGRLLRIAPDDVNELFKATTTEEPRP